MSKLLFFNFCDFFKSEKALSEKSILFQCLGDTYGYGDFLVDNKFKNFLEDFVKDVSDYKIFCFVDDYSSFNLEARKKFLKDNFPEIEIELIQVAYLSKKSYLTLYISEFYNGVLSKDNKGNINIIESNPQVISDYHLFGLENIPVYKVFEEI